MRRRLAAAALSGALYVAAFPGFEQSYLAWVCLVPVLWALDDPRLGRSAAFSIGFTSGLVAQLGSMGWLYHAFRQGSALPALSALSAYVGMSALGGAMVGLWALALRVVRSLGVRTLLAAPVLWVLAEWLSPTMIPTYLANSQYKNPLLIQSLDLWGPLGLSFTLALGSAVIYGFFAALRRRDRPAPLAATALLLALVGGSLVYGLTASYDVKDSAALTLSSLRVGVVQPDDEHQGVVDPGEELRRLREQSREVIRQGVDLVIWPQGAYAEIIRDAVGAVPSSVGALARPLLFGGLRLEPVEHGRHRLFSSAFLADSRGELHGSYDRHYLLAFKDEVPLGGLAPWLYRVLPHGLRLDAGERPSALDIQGIRLAVVMSYEELLPAYVRHVVRDGGEVLVSLGDDWLTRGRGPAVQLALARFRAVENRRYLVHATPSGISAVVDPTGALVQAAPLGARANLVAEVRPLSRWTLYQVLGDWPGIVASGLLLIWLWPVMRASLRRLRERARPDSEPHSQAATDPT
jgi:apolipoprotein N-acyltransferase